jgi:nicotinamide riboside kinase
MKIGLCGKVSVGKTTLIKALAELEQFKDYHVATERSKYLRDQGISLNDDSTVKGQFVFAAERSLELMRDDLLTDRTIYDVSAFTISAKSISWNDKALLVEAFLTLRHEYDLIVYISPEGVDIEDNGVRTTDAEYRGKIDKVLVDMLKQFPPKKLITVNGTTEERIEAIISQLN